MIRKGHFGDENKYEDAVDEERDGDGVEDEDKVGDRDGVRIGMLMEMEWGLGWIRHMHEK